jgi:creatinine amidohydrolase
MAPKDALLALAVCASAGFGQALSSHWEELTGPDFVKAIRQAQGVCLVPFGIIEKHKTTDPLGRTL